MMVNKKSFRWTALDNFIENLVEKSSKKKPKTKDYKGRRKTSRNWKVYLVSFDSFTNSLTQAQGQESFYQMQIYIRIDIMAWHHNARHQQQQSTTLLLSCMYVCMNEDKVSKFNQQKFKRHTQFSEWDK